MKFLEIEKYLSGEKFSAGLEVIIDEKFKETTRIEKILEIIEGKRVVHVGCCDHIPLIKDKINKNIWLHKLLTEKSSECLGVDINKAGIKYLKSELGYNNVIYGNLLEERLSEVESFDWDYIILGEILEHTDNPVMFLKSIKEKYSKNIDKIVISVPNILTKYSYIQAKKGKEMINSDHRYWFTPYTLAKVMYRSGIKLVSLNFVDRYYYSFFERVLRKLKLKNKSTKNPYYYYSTLIGIGVLKKDRKS